MRVIAEEFNSRVRARGGKPGVKHAMERRGFGKRNQKVDGRSTPCYMGLGWTHGWTGGRLMT